MTELETRTSTDKSDKTVKDSISLLTSGFNLDGPTQFAGRVHRGIEHGLSTQQRYSSQAVASNHCKQQQPQVARQPTRQERGKEWGERKKERKGEGERGRSEQEEKSREERGSVKKGKRGKEEGRDAEEEKCKQVEKNAMDWTVVTRNKRQRKRMVQIFVKMNECKVFPLDVSLDDAINDVLKQIQSDEEVYVTMHGRVLRRNDMLKSCGVTDGCTVEVTSRIRGGGKHKDKKGQKERKRAVKPKGPEQKSEEEPKSDEGPALIQMDEVLRRMEGNEEFQKIIDWVSEGSEGEVQQKVQSYLATIRMSWMSKEQFEYLESGVWRAIEARRKERREEHKQRRQEEQGLGAEEKPLEETRAESTDEPEVAGRLVEVRTGRGSTGLVRGGDERNWADESNRKGKGKGNGGKGEHGGKGGAGSKGTQQVENLVMDGDQEDKRGRVAPNMGAGGSHPQATSDPGKKREARVLSWADCKDKEVQNEEEVEEEKEIRQQEELTGEKPPGLEANEESEHEAKEEEERRRAQEAEEKRLAQETQEEEQKRAQEARERTRRGKRRRRERKRGELRRRESKRKCRKHKRKK